MALQQEQVVLGRTTKTTDDNSSNGSSPTSAESSIEFLGPRGNYIPVPRAPRHDPPLTEFARTFVEHEKEGYARAHAGFDWIDWAGVLLPCIAWLRRYAWRRDLAYDLVAGVSIAFMVVPQGISYATAGGLPSVYGLYNAFVPVIIYAAFGSSRQISIGPVAIIYAIVYNGLKGSIPGYEAIDDHNNPEGPEQELAQATFNHLAIQVAVLAGLFQLALRLLRLHFLVNFLSRSVISGFTSAVAVVFIVAQFKNFLGIKTSSSNKVHEQLRSVFDNIDGFKWKEFVMGISWLILLFSFKFLGQKSRPAPSKRRFLNVFKVIGPMTVSILSIVIVVIWNLQDKGIKIVKNIPQGLPGFTADQWFPIEGNKSKVVVTAFVAAIVSLLDATAIGTSLAAANGYDLEPRNEFLALGLANFFGSMFNGAATSGTFSRSAVNNAVGAKTQLGGWLTAFLVGCCLLFLTPVFEKLPSNALAAIVVAGLVSIFDVHELFWLWKVNKIEVVEWVAAFICACFISIEIGLGIAIGVSVLRTLAQQSTLWPNVQNLGPLKSDPAAYRPQAQYAIAQSAGSGVLVLAPQGPLFFGNQATVREGLKLRELRAQEQGGGGGISVVVLDLSAVPTIDGTVVHEFNNIFREHQRRNLQLLLANPSAQTMSLLAKARLDEKHRDEIFVTVTDAVSYGSGLVSSRAAGGQQTAGPGIEAV